MLETRQADAAFLGEVDVERDVGHAHAQALQVGHVLQGLLGVEVAEAQRKGVQGAQAGLFGEAVVDQTSAARTVRTFFMNFLGSALRAIGFACRRFNQGNGFFGRQRGTLLLYQLPTDCLHSLRELILF